MMLRRVLLALGLLSSVTVQAQTVPTPPATVAQMLAGLANDLPNGCVQCVSPAVLRTDLINIVQSFVPLVGGFVGAVTSFNGRSSAVVPANGDYSFSLISGQATLAQLPSLATNTVLGNATSVSAVPTALAVGTCSASTSALIWTTNGGFGCNNSVAANTANSAPASGLTGSSLNSGVTASSLTSVGTLTGGATGTGFTVNFGTSTISGTLGVAGGGTGAGTWTASAPLIGNGTSPITQGARSGNTTTFGTTNGTLTNGHCVSIDASGNLIDAGGACTTGGGGGTVSSATAGQHAYYSATGTIVVGDPNFTGSGGAYTLGVAATTIGQLKLANTTSGVTTLTPGATAAGTLTLPAGTDTLIGKATTDTLTNKTYDTAGTGNSFLINGVAATANTGTGSVVRATSPSISGLTVTSSFAATNLVNNSSLATMAANTIKGNNTGSTANAADLTVAQVAAMFPVPTVQTFTSGTAATYTTPAGATWLKVREAGGGAGGAGSGTSPGAATAGTATTFSTSSAGGGAIGSGISGGAGGTNSGCTFSVIGQKGLAGSTGVAGNTIIGGAGGSTPLFSGGGSGGGAGMANTGGGGSGAIAANAIASGGGGGSGGYCEMIIGSPAATYTYTVGPGGSGGSAGTSGNSGGNGAAGVITVEEHYGQ